MRLFTGFDLPADVVRRLERLVDELRPRARIQWSPPRNLHITTKFIGEWPEEKLEQVKDALGALPGFAAPHMRVRGLGFFPNPHRPRVFWAGVEAPAELRALAAATEDALSRLGVAKEDRPFSPHLTLARIREPVSIEALREAIAALESVEFGEFTAESFWLYQSQPAPGGSVYTKLAGFPVAKG